jgi:hypothetical protein
VQCKRPLSNKGLESCVRKAITQFNNEDAELRLIAVSVSRLLNPGNLEPPIMQNAKEAQDVGGHQKTSFIGHLPVYSSLISSAPKARVIGRSSSKGWKL